MHNQDFEKSVQQKMDELSFTPSASVWEKVKADIRPQQRRRTAFWVLPVALLVGAAGWWLLQEDAVQRTNHSQKEISGVSVTPQTKASERGNEPVRGAGKNSASNLQRGSSEPLQGQENSFKNQTTNYPNTTSVVKETIKQKNKTAEPGIFLTAKSTVIAKTAKKGSSIAANNTVYSAEVYGPEPSVERSLRTVSKLPLLPTNKNEHDISVNGKEQNIALLFTAPQKAKAQRSAWQWGGNLHYGYAHATNRNLLGGAASSDFFNSGPLPSQNGGGVAFRGPNPQIKGGRYLAAGFTLQRKVGRSVSLRTGIQYQMYSQRQGIGEAVTRASLPAPINADALQGNVFYRDQNKSSYYHNKAHQVSVPLLVGVKPIRRIPLELIAGVQVGYIVAAKSLSYDTTTRLYYAAETKVNKLQVAGVAALQYRIAQRGGWELLGGPQVQYHFSRFHNAGMVPQRLYAYSFGLQVRKK